MTNAPTNTFKNRNKSAVVGKSAEDQAKVAFGKSIQLIAAKSRAFISKLLIIHHGKKVGKARS